MSQYKVEADNAKNNFEIYTMTDKAQRDKMFAEHRVLGDEYEKQVVKFSGQRLVLGADGQPVYRQIVYTATGKGGKLNFGKPQLRPVYESTWSVGYPKD